MELSHEVPLCLLEKSREFNDYQFCLPTLMDNYPKYKEFFLNYRKKENSFIILDNGLFEEEKYTQKELIEKINLIKPDIFIVPDKWDDPIEGYKNAKYWIKVIKSSLPKDVKLMVVLQGKTYNEIKNLYILCKDLGYKHFSFNHSSIVYQTEFHHPDILINRAIGRVNLISKLKKEGIIQEGDYIHLLGASSLDEFKFYNNKFFGFINSLDTSLPIINSYKGIKLNLNNIYIKPTNKIEDFIDKELKGKELLYYNVKFFKKLLS